MKIIIPLFMFCLLLACSKSEEPEPKPDIERFFQVYQAFLKASHQDSLEVQNKQDVLDSVLTQHNMKPQEFDATLNYLETHPEEFLKAFEKFDSTMRQETAPPMPD